MRNPYSFVAQTCSGGLRFLLSQDTGRRVRQPVVADKQLCADVLALLLVGVGFWWPATCSGQVNIAGWRRPSGLEPEGSACSDSRKRTRE